MKLFDLSLKLNGYPIDKARTFLNDILAIPDSDYPDYIKNKRKEIFDYHFSNTAFFRELHTDQYESWDDIPVMNKRDLQRPLEERLSDEFKASQVYINKTSGSSGDPFIFAKDKWSHALTWAVICSRFGWYDIDFNKTPQARFYGIPLDVKGYYKERIKDYFSRRFRFSVFDLSDSAFEQCVKTFSRKPFEYINGYTSPIVQFAKYLRDKELILKDICPSLRVCIVTSEMLYKQDKTLMEKWFGVPVVNEYGASELDLIAFQNPGGNWQLNSETLYVEIVDEHGKTLAPGEQGRVVITSLYNKAHPFIRYDIGDIGIIDPNSSIKKPILKKLIGRTNDIAYLPSGKKAAGLTFYYITKSMIEDDGLVKEFIIEQLSLDHFLIKYVSSEDLSLEKISNIREEMIRYLEAGIRIDFERQDILKRSAAGKLKQFISHLDSPENTH